MTPREVAEATYAAFNDGDIEAWKALCSDDMVFITGGQLPYSGTFKGPDDVIQNCFSAIAANYTGFSVKPVEMWESGDSVWTTFVAESAQGRFEGAHLTKVEGGKVVYFRAFDDTQTAAGLLS